MDVESQYGVFPAGSLQRCDFRLELIHWASLAPGASLGLLRLGSLFPPLFDMFGGSRDAGACGEARVAEGVFVGVGHGGAEDGVVLGGGEQGRVCEGGCEGGVHGGVGGVGAWEGGCGGGMGEGVWVGGVAEAAGVGDEGGVVHCGGGFSGWVAVGGGVRSAVREVAEMEPWPGVMDGGTV